MSILESWKGEITLPEVPISKLKIGKNFVYQKGADLGKIRVEVAPSEHPGHELVTTNLKPPFDQIHIRHNGAKRLIEPKLPCLLCDSAFDLQSLGPDTVFQWDSVEAIRSAIGTPQQILDNWKGDFSFKEEDFENSIAGLRAPQIGALHAISAHFSVGERFDAATVVLPTGTGKTETMLSSLLYNRREKLLVLVPTDALRAQVSGKFISLGFLPNIGVVSEEIARPLVAVIKTGVRSVSEAQELLHAANVIVATPNILQSSADEAVATLCGGCSDLFIDEAHHGTANTWDAIRTKFADKRITQFTATPFRNDGRHIGGKIIFNYRLGDAQKAGYYKKIRLHTVEEYGDDNRRNRSIAAEAIRILREDHDHGHEHLIMARVANTKKADDVHQIYQELAPDLHPVVIYTGSGRVLQNRQALKQLIGEDPIRSRVVVCVNMLGEGFDLPSLKVAAIHDNHKSLAVTLQFIGRFTRKGENLGDAAAVINIADPNAERRLRDLYAEGADWDQLIMRLSEKSIDDELKLQDIIEGLRQHGDLHDQFSLWNLSPSMTIQIYQTDCEHWTPEAYRGALQNGGDYWHAINEHEKILVVVGHVETPVRWGKHQDIYDSTYQLLIAHWDQKNAALFVACSDFKGMKVAKVVESITSATSKLFSGPKIFKVLNNVELPLAKSLGASKIGAISFTSYFGPNVTDGLANIEKAESHLNNIACIGYEDGDRVLWGGAQRTGKIWQKKSGTILDWVNWCHKTWEKVTDESDDEPNLTKDFLRPIKLSERYGEPAIAVQWGEHVQSSFADVIVYFDEAEQPLFLVDINLQPASINEPVEIEFASDDAVSIYEFVISQSTPSGYSYQHKSGPEVRFRFGKGVVRTLEEHALIDPFIIRYADGTHSYNNYHIPVRLDAGSYSAEEILSWDWTGIPLNQESMGKGNARDSIQYRTFETIEDDYDLIFNDDGPGEAADLVALKDLGDEGIRLCLVHCKNAKGGMPSASIDNLYVVCGQAQKSIKVKHEGMKKLSINLKRRQTQWAKVGADRFLKGDLKKLIYFTEKSRKSKLKFEVIIVQPGLRKSSVSDKMLKLLATTELYLKKTTEADFTVIGSS